MRRTGALVLLAMLIVHAACDGKSATGPSTTSNPPPPAPADPVVTVQLAYRCDPCVNDPDNYALRIGCVGGRCAHVVWAENPLLPENTLTATVSLTPGVHQMEVKVGRPVGTMELTFSRAMTADNTGGVAPGSIGIITSGTSALEVARVDRCSVSTSFGGPVGQFETIYSFRVVIGPAATVC
jgi:hypothetical protein